MLFYLDSASGFVVYSFILNDSGYFIDLGGSISKKTRTKNDLKVSMLKALLGRFMIRTCEMIYRMVLTDGCQGEGGRTQTTQPPEVCRPAGPLFHFSDSALCVYICVGASLRVDCWDIERAAETPVASLSSLLFFCVSVRSTVDKWRA